MLNFWWFEEALFETELDLDPAEALTLVQAATLPRQRRSQGRELDRKKQQALADARRRLGR